MTAPATPAQVESEIRRVAHLLENKTDALGKLLEDAAEADVKFKLGYARALLVAEASTVAEREARATLAVADELRERKHTEAIADAARESVRSLRDQLSALQSLNRNVRYAAGLDSP